MENKDAIGIFDSGVGGLTVLEKIRTILPNENLIYLGDTKNFPYGDKPRLDIIKFARDNTKLLIEKKVKLIIIACGTATSQALELLKKEFNIPIIGIIDPTVDYIKERNIEKIGVMATKGTIENGAWEKELKRKIPNIMVVNNSCPMMATIAEEGKALSKEGRDAIKKYIKPFKQNNIDKIILGCTHYPIYEKIIKEEMQYDTQLINTGYTVANHVQKFLRDNNLQNISKKDKEIIYLTKSERNFKKIANNILKYDIKIEEI